MYITQTCHYLARPYSYVMADPVYYQSIVMIIVMITFGRGDLASPNRSQVVGTVGPIDWSPVYVNKAGPRW